METVATAPLAAPAHRVLPFEFRATGGEYFRIWIVNLLLTIVTLGIFSAWAKVRRLRYFYGSTQLDGHAFEYHGRPMAILKGRLIAFGLYVIMVVTTNTWRPALLVVIPLIVLIFPWIIMRSRMFQTRMSSWRNIRFGFDGTYGGALSAYVGFGLLAIVTLYIMVPTFLYRRVRYALGNMSYGNEHFRYTTGSGPYYGFVYATLGMFIALIVVVAIVGSGSMAAVLTASRSGNPFALLAALFSSTLLPAVLLYIVGALCITAYYQRSLANLAFGKLELSGAKLHSNMRTWPLAGIFLTNLLGIVFTLGLYYPWAKVRQMRYQLESMKVETDDSLERVVSTSGRATDAVGEEIGDFFDVDFGL